MKKISILGSTGSIGTNTLDIVRANPNSFQVLGLAAGRNLELLKKQILEFRPQIVSVMDPALAAELQTWAKGSADLPRLQVRHGTEGAIEVACADGVQMVIAAMVGAAGLLPTLEAVRRGIHIGLANKETMVVAGALMNRTAATSGSVILPVDSEHNAVFQALQGHNPSEVRRIVLTASGGPFRKTPIEELIAVTPQQALKHPNWDMGAKITIDSATMMNKGLEVIEAHHLFQTPAEKIDIVVHPQSIVHSMVEYIDGSVIAQLGIPDMRIPIGFALAYPKRLANTLPRLDLIAAAKLEFYAPDPIRFPAIRLAYEALRIGKSMPAVLNAANEVAIPYFLDGKLKFTQIAETIESVMEMHHKEGLLDESHLEPLLHADQWARKTCQNRVTALS